MAETLDRSQPRRRWRRAPGQPRARGHRRRPARRPHRAGPRRRHRHGRAPRRPASTGRSSRSRCRADLARYVVEKGSITVDGVSLTVVDGRRRLVHGQPDPRDARPHHARAPGSRRPGQPRGRRDRQVRRAAARPTGTDVAHATKEHPHELLQALYDAQVTIAGHPITWREILGNALRVRLRGRRPAPPGLGLAGRHRRQRAAVHRLHRRDLRGRRAGSRCSGRPAGRCSSSSPASTAGGGGSQLAGPRRGRATRRRSPRAGPRRGERVAYLGRCGRPASWSCQWLFAVIGAGWPAPRWYYWCDAWIFVGSMVATYAMARGWNDFWLAWIAVDLVGVPLLWHSRLLPDGGAVRRLRRPGGLGLRGVAAGQPRDEPRRRARARSPA